MTDPVARLLDKYADGLEASPQPLPNINRLEQRVRGSLRQRSAQRKRSITRLQFGLAAAAAFALVAAGAAYKLGRSSSEPVAVATVPAGDWLSTPAGVTEERKFGDGSSLRLEGESSARVQFVQARGGLVQLDRGAVRLKVHHRDGSTWRVAAGPYEVEAIGTDFTVDWVAGRTKPLRVSVTEGTVALRGPAFGGTRFVSAHQVVEVAADSAANTPAPTPVAVDGLAAEADSPATNEPLPGTGHARATEPSWRELEAAGKYAEAVKAAQRHGLASTYQAGTAEDLLALARAARFANRTEVANKALTSCRSRFAGSAEASMSAFLLGRAASGAQAAAWFATYLKEQPRGALAREALGRLLEAYQAAGDHVSARSAAERYLQAYPDGPHATLAREALHR